MLKKKQQPHSYCHFVVILCTRGLPDTAYLCSCSYILYLMWFIIAITCILPVELGIQHHDFTFSETPLNAWRTWVTLTYQNPEDSATHTLTHIQPLCSSPLRLGLWILFLSDRSRTEEGGTAHFLAAGSWTRGGWGHRMSCQIDRPMGLSLGAKV